ncbi:hypothetical protein P3X46_006248 [Hevea brasiliensis]|uniref:Transmembrane protein n=1 Tax=Hevea brasiliensis TaxID=3981 RepID=A0ABQ9MTG1_HEVBR|nr:hypothetical protein P3X46_006248 [Hevea brasiliensis]
MGFSRGSHTRILFTLFAILFTISTLQVGVAKRPLHGEQWLKKHFLHIESLQKGPVPPSASSPCTHIPGGSGHCPTVNGMDFAGRHANRSPPPPAPPSFSSSILMAANSGGIKTN